jgi:hypothetical protein
VKGKKEADVLRILLQEFLSERPVKKTLKFISEHRTSGCEKWFQIELLRFLQGHSKIAKDEIWKEDPYDYDQRKRAGSFKQRVDITFRTTYKQYYHAIEIKHKSHLAIADIRSDLRKLACVKPKQKDYFRIVFCLLLHPFQEQNLLAKKLADKEFEHNLEFSLKIPSTELSCSVFSATL